MSIKDTIFFPPQPPKPPAKEAPKKPRNRNLFWLLPTGVGIGAFVIGIGIGAAPGATPATPPNGSGFFTATVNVPGPTVTAGGTATVTVPGPTVTGTVAPAPTVTQTVPGPTVTVQAPPPPPVTIQAPPAAAKASFSDGQYEVGVDVQPGKYKTTTPAEQTGGCYVDIQDANGDYKAQEVTDKGFTIITIKPEWKGSVVESRECGDWAKVG